MLLSCPVDPIEALTGIHGLTLDLTRGLEILHLPADHPSGGDRFGHDIDGIGAPSRPLGTDGVAGDEQQAFGEQGVTDQDGGCLVEGDVNRGPTTPQDIVVKGRKIVVDQRVGVDELESAGRGRHVIRITTHAARQAVSALAFFQII